AYMIDRDAAQDETQEALDGLRALGARHGAAYVSFPPDDDIDDSALLSGHPVFWDADGEAMDWNEDPEIESGDEYAAWLFADRDEAIVSDLAPKVREDRELGAISGRTGHAFDDRCAEKGAWPCRASAETRSACPATAASSPASAAPTRRFTSPPTSRCSTPCPTPPGSRS